MKRIILVIVGLSIFAAMIDKLNFDFAWEFIKAFVEITWAILKGIFGIAKTIVESVF